MTTTQRSVTFGGLSLLAGSALAPRGNRYSISARQDLKPNEDGSVDLYIQHASSGADKKSNWLPAPADKFVLMLRPYWLDETSPSILEGSWQPPAVQNHGADPAIAVGAAIAARSPS